jgi:hypothetical protein
MFNINKYLGIIEENKNVIHNINNLNQNIKLDYVINKVNDHKLDITSISLGTLSKMTYSKYNLFLSMTYDDIFIFTIIFLNFIILILKNKEMHIALKLSDKNKENLELYSKYINYFLGFIFIIYTLFMLYMILCEKSYILVNRFSYIYTYLFAAIAIFSLNANNNTVV